MLVALPHRLSSCAKAKWLLPIALLLTATMMIAILGRLGRSLGLWTTPDAIGGLANSAQANSRDTALSISKDGTATVVGSVAENVKRCTVDLSCYLKLRFQGEDVRVVYVNSEGQACINERASHQGLAIKKDQRVEAYGQYQKEGELHVISTCPSNTFYIKVLPDSKQDE